MKPFKNIGRTKEKQPKFPDLPKDWKLRRVFNRICGGFNPKYYYTFYNKKILYNNIAKAKEKVNNRIFSSHSEEMKEHYKELLYKIEYMQDNPDVCVEAINRMIRNSVRKNDLYDLEVGDEDRFELKNMPYNEYLKTEHWQRVKKEVKIKCGGKCVLCNKEDNLHYHHRSYSSRGGLGTEPNDVFILCADCHNLFHKNKKIC